MKRLLATVVLLAGFSGLAQAATLSYTGTTTHTLTGFDLSAATGLTNGTKIFREKNAGDGLYLSGPAKITLTYLGKEAGHTNVFRMPSTTDIFKTNTNAVGAQTTLTSVAGGLLNFSFFDLIACLGIKNGQGSWDHLNSIGVFMESAKSALVMFNDLGNDKDYDDMVVRVQVSPVPVPAALPLFATALGGLGWFARRRKSQA
jgi:hypothetical protein